MNKIWTPICIHRITYIFIISHSLDYVRCRVPWVGRLNHYKIDHNKKKKLPMVSTLIVGLHTMRKLHTPTSMLHTPCITCYIPLHTMLAMHNMLHFIYMSRYIPFHACDISFMACYIPPHTMLHMHNIHYITPTHHVPYPYMLVTYLA